MEDILVTLLQSDIGNGGLLFKRSAKEILKAKIVKKKNSLLKKSNLYKLKDEELKVMNAKIVKHKKELKTLEKDLLEL